MRPTKGVATWRNTITLNLFLTKNKAELLLFRLFMATSLQSTQGLNLHGKNKNIPESFSSHLKSKTIEKSMFVKIDF